MKQYPELMQFAYASEILASLKDDAASVAESILAGRRDQDIQLSETAAEALREGYRAQVHVIYINALLEKMFREARRINPLSIADLHHIDFSVLKQAEEIVAENLAPDPVSRFREEFPLIPELEETIRRNYRNAQIEMLDRISANRGLLSERFFGGRKITRIDDLTGMEGDVHRHGRAVAGVKTDAGKFFYKPHDCSLDRLYAQLVERYFSDCTKAADCICGDGYGLVSELVRAPLKKKEQLHDYYHHLGMLTALFRAIGTTDMHNENLLPCGNKPAAVDLETLFRPSAKIVKPESGEVPLGQEFSDSALSTAILPHYSPSLGCASPLYRGLGGESHLPFCAKKSYSVRGYEKDFIEGFRRGYRRVTDNQTGILDLLMTCRNAPVRYVLRNTMYYAQMQMQLYRGRYLVSREKQDEVINRLRVVYELSGVKVNEPIVAYEAACLREGDIPYFCLDFNGKALCGASPKEALIPDFLEQSIRDRIEGLLSQMNEKNERFETDLIRSLLNQAPENKPAESGITPVAARAARERQVQEETEEICRRIADTALHASDGSIIWYTQVDSMFSLSGGEISMTAASAGFYAACMKKADLSYRQIPVGKYLDVLEKHVKGLEDINPEVLLKRSRSGFFGTAGYLAACDRMAATGIKNAKQLAVRILRQLCERELWLQSAPDRFPELAELLITVCRTGTAYARKKEWIGKCASKLSGFTPDEKSTLAQRASVMAALAMAAKQIGEEKTREASAHLLERIRSEYREDLAGWPDETKKFRWAAPRGMYSPWIGLCALEAEKAGIPGATDLVGLSLQSLMAEENLRYNDSLYHGNALSVLFLTEAARQEKGKQYAQHAGRILASMIRRKKEKGAFIIFPEEVRSAFDVAFVRGTTGVGAAALNWLASVF